MDRVVPVIRKCLQRVEKNPENDKHGKDQDKTTCRTRKKKQSVEDPRQQQLIGLESDQPRRQHQIHYGQARSDHCITKRELDTGHHTFIRFIFPWLFCASAPPTAPLPFFAAARSSSVLRAPRSLPIAVQLARKAMTVSGIVKMEIVSNMGKETVS